MRYLFSVTLLFLLLASLLLSTACTATVPDITTGDSLSDLTPTEANNDAEELITPLHLSLALSYQGTEESGPNTGPVIDTFLEHVDLAPGLNYCAAFVSYIIDQSAVDYPPVQSAVAQHFITDRSIESKQVLRGTATIAAGEIVVWKRGTTWRGHTGFVASEWSGPEGVTIEANTSPGVRASPDAADGVYLKERAIEPGNYFRISHFTPVLYT